MCTTKVKTRSFCTIFFSDLLLCGDDTAADEELMAFYTRKKKKKLAFCGLVGAAQLSTVTARSAAAGECRVTCVIMHLLQANLMK